MRMKLATGSPEVQLGVFRGSQQDLCNIFIYTHPSHHQVGNLSKMQFRSRGSGSGSWGGGGAGGRRRRLPRPAQSTPSGAEWVGGAAQPRQRHCQLQPWQLQSQQDSQHTTAATQSWSTAAKTQKRATTAADTAVSKTVSEWWMVGVRR
jgi:hypothetical protein